MKRIVILGNLLILLLYGCSASNITSLDDTMVLRVKTPLQDTNTVNKIDDNKPIKKIEFPEKKYSLSVKEKDIREILLLLSKETGITIVPNKDVEGKITIDVSEKTLEYILNAITKPLGYSYYFDNGIIRVGKPELISKIFYLNYIKDKRTSTSSMNAAISSGGGSSGVASSTISLNVSTGATSGSSSGGSSSSQQGSVNVTTSGTTDFWSEVIKGLEVIVFGDSQTSGDRSDKGYSRADKFGRKLIVNELAGIVYVTDYNDNIEKIEKFLNEIEKSVKRQVLIQAHIIEVSLNDTFSYGIDWNLLLGSGIGDSGQLLELSQSLVPGVPTKVFQANLTKNKFNALLDAMKEQGQVKILSSPKISTLNNQRAVIKLTTKEVSWITNTTFNADGKLLLKYTTPQIDEVGIFLDVTPQISSDGKITMQIHPSISEKTKISVSPDGSSTKPIIDTREVDTLIDVINGQTIVIAGLIVDKIIETNRSVPFLADIPLIGNFFKYINQEKKKSELVIMLTPYILDSQNIGDIKKWEEENINKIERPFHKIP